MMWEIVIQQEVLRTLKKLPKETSKSLFLFLNEYLPQDLTEAKLVKAKIKKLKGIYLFPKQIPKGTAHIFSQVNFETHLIKVLHIVIHKSASTKKR